MSCSDRTLDVIGIDEREASAGLVASGSVFAVTAPTLSTEVADFLAGRLQVLHAAGVDDEPVDHGGRWSRWSFVGRDPRARLVSRDGPRERRSRDRRDRAARGVVTAVQISSRPTSMTVAMLGARVRLMVEPWCSVFHHSTENLMIGRMATPTRANTAVSLAASASSSITGPTSPKDLNSQVRSRV